MHGFSPQQKAVMEVLRELEGQDELPTLAELGRMAGGLNHGQVFDAIEGLINKGHVRCKQGKSIRAGFVLVEGGYLAMRAEIARLKLELEAAHAELAQRAKKDATPGMWSVYVSYNEPCYPEGMQRVGKRCGITVSVRADNISAALARGVECARRKGCKVARGEWAVKMEVV